MDLSGKIALVTGSAKRLGKAIALALGEAGADLAIHFNGSSEQALEVARNIRAMGRRAEVFQADLANEADIEAMFHALARTFGRLDVLVNNAAIYHPTPLEQLTAAQWDAELAVNARAPALCIRHALPLMPDGSAIVNIADSAAERGRRDHVAYCASKAALISVTQSAARALAGRNIRVNAVGPGIALWQEGTSEEYKERVLPLVPLKRPGAPADVVNAVLFLLGSDYITGQNLHVDGGWVM
ncbi:MAG: SDR family oxidoreductase [Phycisphaerae bacterium]|jgi:NAD(P)-dependent dehydrogenase (short-subunit alcohol dehydrogenase family)